LALLGVWSSSRTYLIWLLVVRRLGLSSPPRRQEEINMLTYAKVVVFISAVIVVGMLSPQKLRAQSVPVQASPVDCDRYAQEYARTHSRNGQVIRGAGGGALLGAGIGALAGGAGAGAAIGAGVGALTGGVRRGSHASRIYNHAYHECMAGRARW
jgi:hypothetical protein